MLRAGLLGLLLLTPSATFAAESGRDKLARTIKEAEKLYQAGKYREAAELLKQANEVEPNPRLLYNIARAYDQAGDLQVSLDYYQQYVGSKEGTDPQLLKRSALAIDRLRGLIEKEAADRRKQEEERKRADAEVAAAKARADAEAAAAKRAQQESEARRIAAVEAAAAARGTRRTAAFVAGSVTLVGVGVGVGFGLAANASYSQFQNAATGGQKDSLESLTRTRALIADIGFGVGIAAAVTAVIVYPKGGGEPKSLSIAPSLGGVRLAGTF